MSNFRIFPLPGILSVTGSASMIGSGSASNPTIFSVDGNNGRLLEVTDDLSNSIFSANTIAGLPVIEAFANNCVVLGQFGGHQLRVTCTSIRGGKCTTASGKYSFVGGGACNTASGGYSTIIGGDGNTASSYFSFVGGGFSNNASGYNSFIGTGQSNTASSSGTFIGGGQNNCASNCNSTISGGYSNLSSGYRSFVGGGYYNSASGDYSIVVGGLWNTAGAFGSFVGGGGGSPFMGCNNRANGCFSSVVGGSGNQACNLNSHIIGSSITSNANNFTFVNNLCQWGGGISDCRRKNTIQDTGFGLNDIVKLRPVSYCWNGDSSCHRKYGFIAQEVQQAMSCVVEINSISRVDENGLEILDKSVGSPILQFEKDAIYASYVNAFKDLKAENDALKAKIEVIEDILKRNNLM